MPTPRKVAMLAEIKDRMERASVVISADYRGLTVAQLTDLRRALRPANVDVKHRQEHARRTGRRPRPAARK